MTLKTAQDAVDFLARNAEASMPSITFFGGEPTLCWDAVIDPLIQYIKSKYGNKFRLSMTTNGTLLTKDRIELLHQSGVDLLLSIDGDQETQNYNRPYHSGDGSFSAILPILPDVIKHWPSTTFRSTLIPETCGRLFDNILFAESAGFNNCFFIPNVFQEWSVDAQIICNEEVRKYSNYFIERFQNGTTPIRLNPLEDGLKKIFALNDKVRCHCTNSGITAKEKCGLGANAGASIDYLGNIYACQEMVSCKGENDPFYIGNIYAGVDDVRRMALAKSFQINCLEGDECQGCKLRPVCDGGCAANNYLGNGDVNRVSPVYCWWMKLMLNEAVYVMHTLGERHNRHFLEYWRSLQVQGKGCQSCLNGMSTAQ